MLYTSPDKPPPPGHSAASLPLAHPTAPVLPAAPTLILPPAIKRVIRDFNYNLGNLVKILASSFIDQSNSLPVGLRKYQTVSRNLSLGAVAAVAYLLKALYSKYQSNQKVNMIIFHAIHVIELNPELQRLLTQDPNRFMDRMTAQIDHYVTRAELDSSQGEKAKNRLKRKVDNGEVREMVKRLRGADGGPVEVPQWWRWEGSVSVSNEDANRQIEKEAAERVENISPDRFHTPASSHRKGAPRPRISRPINESGELLAPVYRSDPPGDVDEEDIDNSDVVYRPTTPIPHHQGRKTTRKTPAIAKTLRPSTPLTVPSHSSNQSRPKPGQKKEDWTDRESRKAPVAAGEKYPLPQSPTRRKDIHAPVNVLRALQDGTPVTGTAPYYTVADYYKAGGRPGETARRRKATPLQQEKAAHFTNEEEEDDDDKNNNNHQGPSGPVYSSDDEPGPAVVATPSRTGRSTRMYAIPPSPSQSCPSNSPCPPAKRRTPQSKSPQTKNPQNQRPQNNRPPKENSSSKPLLPVRPRTPPSPRRNAVDIKTPEKPIVTELPQKPKRKKEPFVMEPQTSPPSGNLPKKLFTNEEEEQSVKSKKSVFSAETQQLEKKCLFSGKQTCQQSSRSSLSLRLDLRLEHGVKRLD
ncbi:hypothetical protein CC80DRAFT_500569 [Byssothecium circinans]|uniref:Uncharacterized protein n=1 Tax=Byssothecium circinans TaxID=147558 RepID=A0A6A5UEF9_9PLEO|nr:hypothetical protein CC80DRAFT_500569 [Byssothecium circinans]